MDILSIIKGFFERHEKRYENLEMMILATIVGLITGSISIIFNKSLEIFQGIIFNMPLVAGNLTIKEKFLIVPLLGGILVGLINKYLIDESNRGFGVSKVMEELRDISHFIMKPKSVLIKTMGTIVTLGSGLSAGRQGPIVHLGGAIGSNIGYRFGYSKKKIAILIGCGVAGSIAGVFNTPIAATLFVLEVLMHKEHLEYFSPIVISSLTSIIITRWVIGDKQILAVAGNFGLKNHKELLYYVVLGVVLGLLAVLYIKIIKNTKYLFQKANINKIISPVIGAAVVVSIGYKLPLVFDAYHGSIVKVVVENLDIKLLLFLLIGKVIATSATLGSGGIGGVFMPGLYIGALGGSIFGNIISNIFPGQIYNVNTYALVGMGGMFAGFSNAPITATIMLLELTNNYSIIFPLLLVSTVSSAAANFIYEENIYSMSLQKDNHS